jgi:hypothetical protein
LKRYERLAVFRDWTLWGELPSLHDGGEPGVELLVCRHLVEKAVFDKPDFVRVAHYRIAAVEHRRGRWICKKIGELWRWVEPLVSIWKCDAGVATGQGDDWLEAKENEAGPVPRLKLDPIVSDCFSDSEWRD